MGKILSAEHPLPTPRAAIHASVGRLGFVVFRCVTRTLSLLGLFLTGFLLGFPRNVIPRIHVNQQPSADRVLKRADGARHVIQLCAQRPFW